MKKALKIVGLIFKILIIIVLIVVTIHVALSSYDVAVDNSFVLLKGSYAVNPTWLKDGQETPIDEIYATLSSDESNIADVTFDIYTYLCKKLMLTEAYGSRAKSVINAWVGDSYENADISADVTNNTSHQYRTVEAPTLNANQKIYHSYTNSVYLTNTNKDSLTGLLKDAIQFGNRYYFDGNKTYIQKGKLSLMEDGEEIYDWNPAFKEEKASATRTYEDSDIRDLDNFIVTRETILPTSCKIAREWREEYSMYLYRLSFSLDCEASGVGSATYYEVSSIRDLLGGFCKDLYYDQLDIEMTLYSNGYLLTRSLVQTWTIKVNLFGLEGHAKSDLNEVFNYKEHEVAIVDFTK